MHSFSALMAEKGEWLCTPKQNRYVMLSFRFQPKWVQCTSTPGPVIPDVHLCQVLQDRTNHFFCHWNYHVIRPLTSKSVSFILPSALPHDIPLAGDNYSLTDSFLRSLSKDRQMGISRFGRHFLQVEQVTKAIVLSEETVQQTLERERARP